MALPQRGSKETVKLMIGEKSGTGLTRQFLRCMVPGPRNKPTPAKSINLAHRLFVKKITKLWDCVAAPSLFSTLFSLCKEFESLFETMALEIAKPLRRVLSCFFADLETWPQPPWSIFQ